jgi:hypothetical protein
MDCGDLSPLFLRVAEWVEVRDLKWVRIIRLRRVLKSCRGLQHSKTLRDDFGPFWSACSPLPLLPPRRSRDSLTSPTFSPRNRNGLPANHTKTRERRRV